MWPDNDCLKQDVSTRASSSSDTVVVDPVGSALAQSPSVANMNFTNSKKIHIGHKIIKVTQNVHNNDVVKGRFLCVELVSPAKNNRLRCSVVVFVLWMLLLTVGFGVYFLCIVLNKPPTRLEIDLPLPQYLWEIITNTTRAERITCTVALALVILCSVFVIVYFTVLVNKSGNPSKDIDPLEWDITREVWLARNSSDCDLTAYEPLRLVVVQHTVSHECYTFLNCAAEMRNIQDYYLDSPKFGYDIPYNFVIGNDGRVYEGRGWGVVGAYTRGYNKCSLGIAFVGDYREEKESYTEVTEAQLNRSLMLLETGVKLGHLDPTYLVVGAKDLHASESPGSNLYNAIRQWKHYDQLNRYHNKTCEEMNAMPKPIIDHISR